MGLSLIGLVSFQLYWINSSLKISEERFKQDVHQALNNVAAKLEQQEALFTISNSFETSFDLNELDSLAFDTLKLIDRNANSYYRNRDSLATRGKSQLEVSVEQEGFRLDFEQENQLKARSISPSSEGDLELEILQIQRKADSIKERSRLENKSEMVTIILDELLTGKRKLSNRLQPEQLDSLLTLELANKGIGIDYFYGVLDQDQDSLIYIGENSSAYELIKSDLRVTLFPNDIIGNINYLIVHFPQQQQYLIRKTWLPLVLALVLILIVVLCFAYSIFTIIRQKKLSTVKNDFINNMTHEFKTPISTIALATEALQDQTVVRNTGVRERYLKIIDTENQRLSRQVEKVLQIASIEKEDFELKIENVDVHKTIEKVLQNIAIQVEKKGGSITTDLQASKQLIPADEHHLTNIIYNLLDNANKYTTGPPQISITTNDYPGKGIWIRVIDNGIGMTKEVINRIFDKFYRKPTGNLHDVKGFGLGLSYVKTLVEAHGGNIDVKSSTGKGSVFEIFLPGTNS
ncbi:MAG: two-component sensor histidine kinase [Cyclobacteriaceae bacterium]|nr:MAG: two-component sensor histidine kinase [Cyclobacteriaceae bacterium]